MPPSFEKFAKAVLTKLAVLVLVAPFTSTGAAEPAPSASPSHGPDITFAAPDGTEAPPASKAIISVQITDPLGIASAQMYWQQTQNNLRCPGKGSDWSCERQGNKFDWQLDLSASEGTRAFHVSALSNGGWQTVSADQTLRVTSHSTGISIALISPNENSTFPPGASFTIAASVHSNGPPIKAVRIRPSNSVVSYELAPDLQHPDTWSIPATAVDTASGGEQTFQLEASFGSGATASAGPFRIIVKGSASGPNPPGTGARNVTIYQHVNVSATLDEARADDILANGNKILAQNDGSYDVACPLAPPLSRSGPVQTFNLGSGSIDTDSEMRAMLNLPGHSVYIVNEIGFCGRKPYPHYTILGCSDTGTPIVAVRMEKVFLEGMLWFHEHGHVKGLAHVDVNLPDPASTNIMHPDIYPTHTMVNSQQCAHYQAPYLVIASLSLSVPQLVANTSVNSEPIPLSSFMQQVFIEGLPWEQAERYSVADVPALLSQLSHPDQNVYLPTVVGTLGVIGDVSAVEPLISFIEQGEGRLDYASYGAKKEALLALGQILARNSSPQALQYLDQGLDPAYWEKTLKWQLPYDAPSSNRDWQMVKAATWALGLSGRPEGSQAMERLQSRIVTMSNTIKPPGDLDEVIREALSANSMIAKIGIREYYVRNQ